MTKPAREPSHFAYIDACRGLAFLGVLLAHCAFSCGNFPGSNLAKQGAYGVQLFFLASAITLCYSMQAREEKNHYTNFYLRRLFRIAPLFWLSMIIYWTIPGIIPPEWLGQWAPGGVSPLYFVLTAFFVHGWHPYTFNSIVPGGWSIAVEMTFYVVFPLCFKYINSLRKAVLWLLAGLIFTKLETIFIHKLMAYFWQDYQNEVIVNFFTRFWFPSQFAVFLAGIFAYHLLTNKNIEKIYKNVFWARCLFLYCALILLSLLRAGTSGFIPLDLLVVLCLAGLIISMAGGGISYLVNTMICKIGTISYSCYLTHFVALAIVIKLHQFFLAQYLEYTTDYSPVISFKSSSLNIIAFTSMFFLTLILTTLFSTLTYNFIEKPGMLLGKNLIKRLNS